MADRSGDQQAFASLVRDLECEMATRTKGLQRPTPFLGVLATAAVAAAVIPGVFDLRGAPAIYAYAIVLSVALLIDLVRLAAFDWLAVPELEQRQRPAEEENW